MAVKDTLLHIYTHVKANRFIDHTISEAITSYRLLFTVRWSVFSGNSTLLALLESRLHCKIVSLSQWSQKDLLLYLL